MRGELGTCSLGREGKALRPNLGGLRAALMMLLVTPSVSACVAQDFKSFAQLCPDGGFKGMATDSGDVRAPHMNRYPKES